MMGKYKHYKTIGWFRPRAPLNLEISQQFRMLIATSHFLQKFHTIMPPQAKIPMAGL